MAIYHLLDLGIFLICWHAQPTYTEQYGLQVLLGGRLESWQHFRSHRFSTRSQSHIHALVTLARVGILLPYLLEQQFTKRECHSKNRQSVAPALEHCRGVGAAKLTASLHSEL